MAKYDFLKNSTKVLFLETRTWQTRTFGIGEQGDKLRKRDWPCSIWACGWPAAKSLNFAPGLEMGGEVGEISVNGTRPLSKNCGLVLLQ